MAVKVGFHTGRILTFLSSLYNRLEFVLREAVQNAIDKSANKILINIDLENKRLIVDDNGIGADKEELELKLQNIGKRLKSEKQIGEKGIGILAGLSIGERVCLITNRIDEIKRNGHLRYKICFSRKKLEQQEQVFIPITETNEKIDFTSRLIVEEVQEIALSTEHYIILEHLGKKFGKIIKDRGIEIIVFWTKGKKSLRMEKVTPYEFKGQKGEEIAVATKFGPVIFEFYSTVKKIANPEILIVHKKKESVELQEIDFYLSKKAKELYFSGHFQGYIHLGFCTITPDRRGFEQNEEFEEFIKALEIFASKYLQDFMERLKNEVRQELWNKAYERLLKAIKTNKKIYNSLTEKFKGIVSDKHFKAKDFGEILDKVFGEVQDKSKGKTKKKSSKPKVPRIERIPRDHSGVTSKKGSKRYSLGRQPGISIDFVEPPPHELWRSRFAEGILEVNITHRDFRKAEERGERALAGYIWLLMAIEFTKLNFNSVWLAKQFENQVEPIFDLIDVFLLSV